MAEDSAKCSSRFFFEHHIIELEKKLRMEDQHGFFQNVKSVQLGEGNKDGRTTVCPRRGRETAARQRACPREAGAIHPLAAERETGHTRSRHPEEAAAASSRECPRDHAHGRGDCHNDEGKGKGESRGAGWPSCGTAELGLQQNRPSCWSSIGLPPSSGARGKSHSSGKTRSLPYSTRRATRRSVETTAASCSCHSRVRFSLMWLPEDSALTVRRRDCYRRSNAGFGRIARPWV